MPVTFFTAATYSLLEDATIEGVGKKKSEKQAAKKFFNLTINADDFEPDSVPPIMPINKKSLFKNRVLLTNLFSFYDSELNKINPIIFNYLNDCQKKVLRQQLIFTFCLLHAQYQLVELEGAASATLRNWQNKINLCSTLIKKLHQPPSSVVRQQSFCYQPSSQKTTPKKILDLIGITSILPWSKNRVKELQNSPTKAVTMQKWIDSINTERCFWMATVNVIYSVLLVTQAAWMRRLKNRQILEHFFNVDNYLGLFLTYLHLILNIVTFLKHTVSGFWMHEHKKKIPFLDRLQAQWKKQKYVLISSMCWRFLHTISFLGYVEQHQGNVFTAWLLLFEIILAIIKLVEAIYRHKQEITIYKQNLRTLNLQKSSDQPHLQLCELTVQIAFVDKLCKTSEFNWRFMHYHLMIDIGNAIAKFLSFCVAFGFIWVFPPFLAPAPLLIALIGFTLNFVLEGVKNALCGVIEIKKANQSLLRSKVECSSILENCHLIITKIPAERALDDAFLKQYYLLVLGLQNQAAYDQKLNRYHQISLLQSLVFHIIVPPIVLPALLFASWNISLILLVITLGLTIGSNKMLEEQKPQQPKNLSNFDKGEFTLFIQKLRSSDLSSPEARSLLSTELLAAKTKNIGFFSSSLQRPESEFQQPLIENDTEIPIQELATDDYCDFYIPGVVITARG